MFSLKDIKYIVVELSLFTLGLFCFLRALTQIDYAQNVIDAIDNCPNPTGQSSERMCDLATASYSLWNGFAQYYIVIGALMFLFLGVAVCRHQINKTSTQIEHQ